MFLILARWWVTGTFSPRVRIGTAVTSALYPGASITGDAGESAKPVLLRVVKAIEQWFFRVRQLL